MSSINQISGIAPVPENVLRKRPLEEEGMDREKRKYRRITRSTPSSPALPSNPKRTLTPPPESESWKRRKIDEINPSSPTPSPVKKVYRTMQRTHGVLSPKKGGAEKKEIAGGSKRVLNTLDPTTIALSSSPGKKPNPQLFIQLAEKEEKIFQELQGAPHVPGLHTLFHANGQKRTMLVEDVGPDLYHQYLDTNNPDRDPAFMEDIERLSKQFLETLKFMHQNGYVHGDIKPLNLSAQGHTFDFGNSQKIGINRDSFASGLKYTAAYRPPENAAFKQSTLASDMWSLGTILWELYTNETLFPIQDNLKDPNQTSIDLFHAYQKRLGIQIPSRIQPKFFNENTLKKPSDEKLFNLKQFAAAFSPPCSEKELHLFDLIRQMLKFNPKERISAEEALRHPFFTCDSSTDRTFQLSVKGDFKHSVRILSETGVILKTIHQKYSRPSYCCHIPKESTKLRFQLFDPNFPNKTLNDFEVTIHPTQKELEINIDHFPMKGARKLFEA